MGHVRGRRAFDELRRSPTRSSSGPIRITLRPPGDDAVPPGVAHAPDSSVRDPHPATEARRPDGSTPLRRVAFAVPRSVGTAVERNRARRRLRAQLESLLHDDPSLLPAGDYLVAVRRAPRDSGEARTWLIRALRSLPAPAAS